MDLEAEFKPSLLNSAVYLLQLIQQISTFAINYQGRPFRESLSENKAMFYGILGVSAIAFACSTETFPELNEQMRLVKFTEEFRWTMTVTMIADYAACWLIEVILKRFFSDFRPRDIAERRPDQLARERARKEEERKAREAEEEKKRLEKVAEIEAKIEARRQQLEAWRAGRSLQQRQQQPRQGQQPQGTGNGKR